MSQLKDAITRATGPGEVKRVLNLRGSDIGLDTTNFGGTLSSSEDTAQKALDVLDDIFGSDVSITGDLTLVDTAAGASPGPFVDLYRNENRANDEMVGTVQTRFKNASGNDFTHWPFLVKVIDATDGSVDTELFLRSAVNNSNSEKLIIGQGVRTSGATGGDPGADKINAAGYEINGTAFGPPEVFRSSGSSITADSTHTFAHGLSAEPDMAMIWLQCTTADANWSVGDRILIASNADAAFSGDVGTIVETDSTNVVVHVAENISILDKSTLANTAITLGSWDMYCKAVYFG